ncbi:MAG: DUF998 domain-containing protein [Anaerolineales bacterium]|nr:DUF998 domain-containing protein [Anaerolineales bacterium]
METSLGLPNMLQKILLSCGILAALLYLGTDWLAGKLLKGYSFVAQSISELSAAGSPTRALVVSLTLAAGVFMIAFGVGVWRAAGQVFLPRVVGGLVIGNVVAGLVAILFFPTRFGERPVFGSVGVIVMFLGVVFFVLAMVLGALAYSGWFRIFSVAIPVTYVLLAILRFATATTSSAGETVSLVGAQERTMSYSFLLWVMALAIHLLLLSSRGMDSASGIGG